MYVTFVLYFYIAKEAGDSKTLTHSVSGKSADELKVRLLD